MQNNNHFDQSMPIGDGNVGQYIVYYCKMALYWEVW